VDGLESCSDEGGGAYVKNGKVMNLAYNGFHRGDSEDSSATESLLEAVKNAPAGTSGESPPQHGKTVMVKVRKKKHQPEQDGVNPKTLSKEDTGNSLEHTKVRVRKRKGETSPREAVASEEPEKIRVRVKRKNEAASAVSNGSLKSEKSGRHEKSVTFAGNKTRRKSTTDNVETPESPKVKVRRRRSSVG
jgi:hypothetical protein